MTDNIIKFPKSMRGTPPVSMEETLQRVESARKEHIDWLLDDVCAYVFSRLGEEGLDLVDESSTKYTALVIKSLESAMYHCYRIEHPMQIIAEKIFQFSEDIEKAVDFIDKAGDSTTTDETQNQDT